MGDHELLERYAADGSEDAFRSLVRKYTNLVYSAAFRRTGNRPLAEEVAQNVFTILARKARKRGAVRPGTLGPWLHRTTVLESANARRKEQRREQSLARLANDAMTESTTTLASSREARELLDEAIDALPDGDRAILLLHYYEGKSYREVGSAIGKSEAASRKQASRALGKLSRILERKGFTISLTALAASLAPQLSKAAPAGLSQSLSAASIAGAGGVTKLALLQNTLQTMAYAKTKTAAAVALVAAIPLVSQWHKNNDLASELATLRDGGERSVATRSGNSPDSGNAMDSRRNGARGKRVTSPATGLTRPAPSVVRAWESALLEPDPLRRSQRLSTLLADLTAENAPDVLKAFEAASAAGGTFDQEMRLFMRAWGTLDGEAAVAHALEGKKSDAGKEALSALGGWASADPDGARAWIEGREEGNLKEQLVLGLLDGWSMNDFAAAAAYAETRPRSQQRDKFVALLLRRSLLSGGIAAAQSWFSSIADDEHNAIYKRRAFNGVVQAMLYRDPSQAAAWISQNAGEPYVERRAVVSTAGRLASESPEQALAWIASVPAIDEQTRTAGLGKALQQWSQKDSNAVGTWLGGNMDHPEYDLFAQQHALTIRASDPEAAKEWANTIGDEQVRSSVLKRLESQLVTTRFVELRQPGDAQFNLTGAALSDPFALDGTEVAVGTTWNGIVLDDSHSLGVARTTDDATAIYSYTDAEVFRPLDAEAARVRVELEQAELERQSAALKTPHPPTNGQSCVHCHRGIGE